VNRCSIAGAAHACNHALAPGLPFRFTRPFEQTDKWPICVQYSLDG